MKSVIVIGGGYSGLSAAAYLAKSGFKVRLLEKNSTLGGRGRHFSAEGFHFDMGPSWYWMPDVFEQFYSDFGFTTTDFYHLTRLDPSYRIVFKDEDFDVPASLDELYLKFENIEKGSSTKLKAFLKSAQYKYEVGMNEYVQKPGHSILEYFELKVLKSVFRLNMFSSLSKEVRKSFSNPKLIQLLEFPVLFLGAPADRIPALYSLMNYADLSLGTWYPQGGMGQISLAMEKIVRQLGVDVLTNAEVIDVTIENGRLSKVHLSENSMTADYVLCAADYQHFDQKVLPSKYSAYSEGYWEKRKMAPSSLLFYLGVDREVPSLRHHNLFFDADFNDHSNEIYDSPKWPKDPLFYICCPSKSDSSVAPPKMENLFILVPLASGISDSSDEQKRIFSQICKRIEQKCGLDIESHIVYKRSFSLNNFRESYNAFKGNAYGLSNTLFQTGFLKPKMKSKKISNLFYAGQLTTPGPGVPPSLISGQVAANQIIKANSN